MTTTSSRPTSTTFTSTVRQAVVEQIELGGFGGMQFGGDGSSLQTPVLIAATSSHIGVPLEYAYLETQYGTMGRDWTVALRSLELNDHGRTVESFRLALSDGSTVDFYFDVTSFYRS